MTPEQFVAILVALAAVLAAVARCIAELRAYDRGVNIRIDQLASTMAGWSPGVRSEDLLVPPPRAGPPAAQPPTWSDKLDRGRN